MLDLHGPARRGLFWASLLCVAAAVGGLQLADLATDEVHRVMFGTATGSLLCAAAVLQVVRLRLRWRGGRG